jgi:glycosyltransferase involved in cell wall biosynthesis
MNIGIYYNIDLENPGGVQQYSEKLLIALLKYTNNKIFLFSHDRFYNNLELNSNEKANIVYINIGNCSSIKIKKILENSKLNVLHIPYQELPFFDLEIPTVLSLHDLQHEHFPNFFTEEQLAYRDKYYKLSANITNQIVVTVKNCKDDIINFYKIPERKISITSFGMENRFEDTNLMCRNELQARFDFKEGYIFYPAQTWKHKNHITLLKALKKIKENNKLNFKLICSGMKNEYYKVIKKYIEDNDLSKDIIFTGFVSNSELYSLYKHCNLVVIPTLFEAESLPLLEAMSLEVPVICSDVTSLPSTIGDNRFIFESANYIQLSELILKMMEDDNLVNENIGNSKVRIQEFDWKNVIKNFEDSYEIAIKNYNEYKYYEKEFIEKSKIKVQKDINLKKIEEKINEIKDDGCVIYGSGIHTIELIDYIKKYNKKILFIVDSDMKKYGSYIDTYKVENPKLIVSNGISNVIISSLKYQDEIYSYLKNDLMYKGNIIKLYERNEEKPFYMV